MKKQELIIGIDGEKDISVKGEVIVDWTSVTAPTESYSTLSVAFMKVADRRVLLVQEMEWNGNYEEYTGRVVDVTDSPEEMLDIVPLYDAGKAFLKKVGVSPTVEYTP